jgi:multiphosphoryl transfer protein
VTQAPTLLLQSPLAGWAMPLEEVPDAVFAGRMLGDGLAIDPTSGALHAPCDGSVTVVAPTGHAISITSDLGAELLIHVGIDTVGLKGQGFEPRVAAGRRVRAGELLLEFDLDLLARRAASLVTPLLVTNPGSFEILRRASGLALEQGAFLMELRASGAGHANARGDSGASRQRRIRVPLPHGIHARPAGQIVQALRGLDARVTVQAHGRKASAASAVALMSLGVRRDDEIVTVATGPDAEAAIEALASMLGGDGGTPTTTAMTHA